MFKLRTPQRVIEYPVKGCEYVDIDGNIWTYNAYVQMNSNYEVLDVRIEAIECEIDGQLFPLNPYEGLKDGFRKHAANLALERVCAEDFAREVSND